MFTIETITQPTSTQHVISCEMLALSLLVLKAALRRKAEVRLNDEQLLKVEIVHADDSTLNAILCEARDEYDALPATQIRLPQSRQRAA